MGKKPKTHVADPDREVSPTAASWAAFSLCGIFLYQPEQVDNANPSCQKCRQSATSRRRVKGRQHKTGRRVTEARRMGN